MFRLSDSNSSSSCCINGGSPKDFVPGWVDVYQSRSEPRTICFSLFDAKYHIVSPTVRSSDHVGAKFRRFGRQSALELELDVPANTIFSLLLSFNDSR